MNCHDGPVPPEDGRRVRRTLFSLVPAWLRHGLVIFLVLLVVEYLVIPELIGASRDLRVLHRLNVGWIIAGVALEAAAIFSYSLLTRTLLPRRKPPVFTTLRIVLSTTAIAHVVPGGAAGGAGLGYQLLTSEGVDGADAGFALATQAVGSAIVLNVMLWVALVASIPLAGLHPIYVVTALVGVVALFAAAALVYTFTRGERRAVGVVRHVGRRIPFVGADRLERLVHQVGRSLGDLGRDREVLKRALLWATLNWLLDAASLWSFLAALGHFVDPVELFAAYGIANVLAVIPITPGGLGVVEASAAALLVSFGLTKEVATLGVIGWRLVNYWLPIPVGAAAFLSLRVPRGSRIKARRQALSDMAEGAKQPGEHPFRE